MKGQLILHFNDDQHSVITLDHVVGINVPAPSVEFAMNKAGKWTMRITTGLTQGRKLIDAGHFLTAEKIVENNEPLAQAWHEFDTKAYLAASPKRTQSTDS